MILSWGTPICWPDRVSQKQFCLLGAKLHGMVKKVPQPVKGIDCYSLLFFHAGTNDTARWNLDKIKKDDKALGMQAKSIGAKVIPSSILPVRGKGAARNRHTMQIKFWLHNWCGPEGFGFRVLVLWFWFYNETYAGEESGLVTVFANSLRTLGDVSSGPMGLCKFRFLKWSQIWSSPVMSET